MRGPATRETKEEEQIMVQPVMNRPWLEGRDERHAAEARALLRRWDEVQTEKREFETEEDELLHERLQPGYAQRRLRAAGEAVAAGRDPAAEPDHEVRLQQIATAKRERQAGLDVLGEQWETAYQAARNEFSKELRPKYVELLKPLVAAAISLVAAAEAERQFRDPLRMQDISFAGGTLQGVPLAGTQPDGSIWLWLRKINQFYPEIGVEKKAKKAGVEL